MKRFYVFGSIRRGMADESAWCESARYTLAIAGSAELHGNLGVDCGSA